MPNEQAHRGRRFRGPLLPGDAAAAALPAQAPPPEHRASLVDAPRLVVQVGGGLEVQVLEPHAANQALRQLVLGLQRRVRRGRARLLPTRR